MFVCCCFAYVCVRVLNFFDALIMRHCVGVSVDVLRFVIVVKKLLTMNRKKKKKRKSKRLRATLIPQPSRAHTHSLSLFSASAAATPAAADGSSLLLLLLRFAAVVCTLSQLMAADLQQLSLCTVEP